MTYDDATAGGHTRAGERPPNVADTGPGSRDYRPELGIPRPDEQAVLARTFGAALRLARGALTQRQLADRSGLNVKTIKRLENGRRRPTTASVRKIVHALREDVRGRIALEDRLRREAGPSLRDYSRRPHVARERVRARLLAEQGDGPLIGPGDTLGNAIAVNLAELARRSRA